MSSFDPTMDAVFRESAELELRCHYLLLEGKENTPESLAAEDRMTVLWEKLDEVQAKAEPLVAVDGPPRDIGTRIVERTHLRVADEAQP